MGLCAALFSTERVIAMGFPSSGRMGWYRNNAQVSLCMYMHVGMVCFSMKKMKKKEKERNRGVIGWFSHSSLSF